MSVLPFEAQARLLPDSGLPLPVLQNAIFNGITCEADLVFAQDMAQDEAPNVSDLLAFGGGHDFQQAHGSVWTDARTLHIEWTAASWPGLQLSLRYLALVGPLNTMAAEAYEAFNTASVNVVDDS